MIWLSHPALKLLLLATLAGLTVGRAAVLRGRRFPGHLWLGPLSIAAVVLAAATFLDRAPWDARFVNSHDLFHQYFGAKYGEELDREGFYRCVLVGLEEVSPSDLRRVKEVRDLETYAMVPKRVALAEGREPCRARFAPERWAAFVEDLDHFRRLARPGWPAILTDKGHNATPVWNLIAGSVAEALAARSRLTLNLLGIIDWLLLAAAFVVVGRLAGWWPAALGLLFLGGGWELTSRFIRGSLLRWDWLALSIVALVAWRRERFRLAGGLLGGAFVLRVFPVLFLLGPAVVFAREVWRTRRLPAWSRRLFGTFAVVAAVAVGTSVVADGGLQGWRAWSEKIATHNEYVAGFRVGLQQVVVFGLGLTRLDTEERKAVRDRRFPLRLVLGVGLLALLGYVLWRREEIDAAAFSFPAVFVLVTPTFYYFSMLGAVVAACAVEPRRRHATDLILGLTAVEGVLQLASLAGRGTAQLALTLSWGLFVVCVVTLISAARGREFFGGPAPK